MSSRDWNRVRPADAALAARVTARFGKFCRARESDLKEILAVDPMDSQSRYTPVPTVVIR